MHAVCATPWPWRSSCASHFRGWLPCVKIQVVLLLCKCDCLVVLCCYVFVFPTRRIAKLCIAAPPRTSPSQMQRQKNGAGHDYRIIPDGIGCPCPPNTDFPRNCWRLFCLAPFCLRTRVPRRICSGFALQHLYQQVHLRCVMRFCPLNTVCTHIAVVMCVQKMSWISCSLARAGSFGHVLRWRDSASSCGYVLGFLPMLVFVLL